MALNNMKHLWLLFTAVLVLNSHAQQVSELSVQETAGLEALDVLIKRRQYPQAYVLADRLAEDNEGEATFDFQYGLAALETAHYDQALFAFERLVLIQGDQPRYRLELARTHFFLRNLERAQIEFQRVLKQHPPKEVQQNVQGFLRKIVQLQRSVEPKFNATFDMAAGFDSNINSATDEEFLPKDELVFPVDIRLSSDSRETESSFISSLVNLSYLSPISNTSSFDVRLVGSSRVNSEVDTYDLTTLLAEAGFSFYSRYTGPIKWRSAGRYQNVQLNSDKFLNISTGLLQAFYEHGSGIHFSVGLNLGLFSYVQNQDGDLNQAVINVSMASAPQKHSWVVALQYGQDEAEESINDYSGRSYQGITLQSSHLWGKNRSFYFLLGVMDTEYDDINRALYSELREDITVNAGFGWRVSLDGHLSIRNDYSWNNADSTLQANSFERFKTELGVSYSF